MTFVPIDNFARPDSPTLGPGWLDESVFPPHLHIVDGHAVGGLTITGAACIGDVDASGGMVLTGVDLHSSLVQLGVGIGDTETRDGDPYGDPSWEGGTKYIWPGYRAQFGPSSVEIVQVNMVLVDVGEAFLVATTTTDLLASGGFALPDGPVDLAVTLSGDGTIIAYVNGTVVLTALGTGGLGIGGGTVAFWLMGDATAGGAGGQGGPPLPVFAVVSLNHPLSNRLLDGPRLSTTPVAGVSLNAKLLDGHA
jgi:hypothetical protein